MSQPLRIALIGPMTLTRAGSAVSLKSAKARALLAYLAVTGQAQPRPVVAALLWGDRPEGAALANLRMALTQLRRAAPAQLSISRTHVAFDGSAPHWLDVAAFDAAYADLAATGVSADTLPALQTAAELVRGEFLSDVIVSDAPAFEDWLLLERQRLRQQAIEIWHGLATYYGENGRTGAGMAAARRILALDPWRETAHQLLIQLLAADGQRAAALAQFEACRRALAEELGVDPAPETVALAEALRRRSPSSLPIREMATLPAAAPGLAPPPHNLPAPTTPFVGRQEQLAQAAALLGDPDCRLLTLIGPGGIGKTRLALAVAEAARSRMAAALVDGVFFVPLASVTAAEGLMPAIAEVVGLELAGADSAAQQLQRYLHDRKMLLVLDNLEHMTAEAPQLVTLLAAAPELKLVVTSRARLQLYEEWLLRVPGLPLPPPEATAVDPSSLLEFASVQLFQQRARRLRLNFDLAAEAREVVAICRLVEGMPLAIELAAAWAGTLSCAEIAHALRHNLEGLTARSRNRPARHQSLEAAFDHSWRLLSAAAQQALCRLTVFQGGFSRAAAQGAGAADPAMLAGLLDKSLVERSADGRYDLHNLLRQLAGARLDTGARRDARAAHARFYVGRLVEETAALRGPEPEAAARDLLPDIDNLRAAWHFIVAEPDVAAVEQAAIPLFELFDLRARYIEGEALLQAGLEALAPSLPASALLLARLGALHGRFLTRLGRFAQSAAAHRQALPLLATAPDRREYGDALNGLSNVLRRTGAYDEARDLLDQAQQVYQEVDFTRGVASVLNNRGLVAFHQGDYDTAADRQRRSAALYRQTGPRKDLATVLNNLGLTLLTQGDHDAAESQLTESAAIAEEIGYHACVVVATQNLGLLALRRQALDQAEAHLLRSLEMARRLQVQDMTGHIEVDLCALYRRMGRLEEARRHGSRALQIGRTLGLRALEAGALASLGRLALAADDLPAAARRLATSLRLAQALDARGLVLSGLVSWAELLARQGEPAEAAGLLAALQPRLAATPDLRGRARSLAAEVRAQLSPAAWEAALDSGAERRPEEWSPASLPGHDGADGGAVSSRRNQAAVRRSPDDPEAVG